MGHVHTGSDSRLLRALLLTGAVLLVEVGAGFWSQSLALLSDAGHVLTDLVAIGLALFAVRLARRAPDSRRTYGYHRAGILVALFNAVALVVVVLLIGVEAVIRLQHPVPIQGGVMIGAALLALAANAYIAAGLHRVEGDSLNVRAVLLHVLGDLGAAVGVVVAGAVVLLTGWLYADPLISIAIAVLITWSAVRLVLETLNVLLEGTPRGMDVADVSSEIAGLPGVESVHDLHVWALSPEHTALSCHVVVSEQRVVEAEAVVRGIENRVCSRFGIGHTTVQVESGLPCSDEQMAHAFGVHNHPHSQERG